MELTGYIISGFFAVLVALIETRAARDRRRSQEEQRAEQARTEARAQRRARESMLSMAFMNATCGVAVVTAKAVTHQHINGDVEEAMEEAEKARKNYSEFVAELAAQQVVKQ